MTGKEIIRALRLCSCETSTRNCPNCPLSGNDDCVTDALREAADIIEHLTAENAALWEKVPQCIATAGANHTLESGKARRMILNGIV